MKLPCAGADYLLIALIIDLLIMQTAHAVKKHEPFAYIFLEKGVENGEC